MPTKLIYFDARALAERTRYMLAMAGVEYEDKRYPFTLTTPGDFSTVVRPEFDAARAAGELDIAMGKVPILEIDGVRIPQSKTIERYVAKKYGFMGSTDVEAAFIDAFADHCRDIVDAFTKAKTAKGADLDAFLTGALCDLCNLVEKAIPAELQGPFLFGEKPSLADVCFFYFFVDSTIDNDDQTAKMKAAYDPCPKLKAAMEAMAAIDAVVLWRQNRPKTTF
mmetsp:Transcript_24940/g.77010  ORF Transcript_24940/g.77010 Transcript_24940/m.77010 type:complete len:223 (-) Transcript_24940:241-909(-)